MSTLKTNQLSNLAEDFVIDVKEVQPVPEAYTSLGAYGAGIVFNSYTDTFTYVGVEHRPLTTLALPYTTTGVGAAEIASFRVVGDAALRDDLAATGGAGLIGYDGATVESALDSIKARNPVNVKDLGAVGDGVTDDSAAFIAARTLAHTQGSGIYAPGATYKLNSAVTSTENLVLSGDGDLTVLDFSGTLSGGSYGLEATGATTLIADLSGTHLIGARTLVFASAPALVVGDVFVIHNPTAGSWSSYRTEYNSGEWCKVEAISGSTVTVRSPLYDTYTAASVDVYKITSPVVDVSSVKVVGTTTAGLVRATLCLYPKIRNLTGVHAGNSVVYFDRCFSPSTTNPMINNQGSVGDDYGVSIGNSQHSRIYGGDIYSRRHAVTHGGNNLVCNVSCRDSRVIGATLSNNINSGVEAADFHGNTEDSSYIDCTIYGGANLQGKNNKYSGCTITNILAGPCVQHAEPKGGYLGMENCHFITSINPQLTGRGVYDAGGNTSAIAAGTVEPLTLFVRNCSVSSSVLSAISSFMIVRNSGTTSKINIEIDGLTGDLNLLGQVLLTRIDAGPAVADSDFIIIDNIKKFPSGCSLHAALGSAYLNFPHRLQRQSGSVSLQTTSGTNLDSAASQVFRYVYPRIPHSSTGTAGGAAGTRFAVPTAIALTTSAITPAIHSGDTTNWTATQTRIVSWAVEITEV